MSVKIRLKRMGAMKRPFYRIVVADSRSPRDGRFIEILGYYNPCVEPSELKIDGEKAKLWLGRGAQPTETAGALLKKEGLLERIVPRPARPVDPKKAASNKSEKTKNEDAPIGDAASSESVPTEQEPQQDSSTEASNE
jgi:small subunit ribosomal protein S16